MFATVRAARIWDLTASLPCWRFFLPWLSSCQYFDSSKGIGMGSYSRTIIKGLPCSSLATWAACGRQSCASSFAPSLAPHVPFDISSSEDQTRSASALAVGRTQQSQFLQLTHCHFVFFLAASTEELVASSIYSVLVQSRCSGVRVVESSPQQMRHCLENCVWERGRRYVQKKVAVLDLGEILRQAS